MTYEEAALILKCKVSAIRAIAEVESRGEGFLPNGQPKILFEAHIFSRLTNRKYDKSHPHLSSRTWNQALYKGGIREHDRLAAAAKLDRNAAIMSASWGRFQIMGFNWQACGFQTLQGFINSIYSDKTGLNAFVGLVLNNPYMRIALQTLNFARFAELYNGSGYRQNKYDTKMLASYQRYEGLKA